MEDLPDGCLRILALEPYYGGSHRAFLDRWIAESRHRWTLLTLPPFKWKWRMRHSATTFALDLQERLRRDPEQSWDLVFCSDMLNLAELFGLAPPGLRRLPSVAYFHENQLTYPVRFEKERDLHFALTNLTTALAATELWFNSAFHRQSFLAALPRLLQRMPDFQPFEAVGRLAEKAKVVPQGIEDLPVRGPRRPGSLRVLWAARWEFDKNPEAFFAALEKLEENDVEFRVSVLGESFRRVPEIFAWARERFRDRVDRWGYLERREEYVEALLEADVFVSTADHEFFGVSAAEAMAAGALPLLPERLAYPELLAGLPVAVRDRCLYDGSPEALAGRLEELAAEVRAGGSLAPPAVAEAADRFRWPRLRPRLDEAVARVNANPVSSVDPGS